MRIIRKKNLVVLDTSLFVNPDARKYFGHSVSAALGNFLDAVKAKNKIICYMPPSVFTELSNFLEEKVPASKTALIKKQPPASYQTSVPALFVYEFIEEMRSRINKGLRIAEKYSRKNEQNESSIAALRVEYRVALREGIVDSKEDFDLILLAKQLNATLATSDQGLVKWAEKLGIPAITPEELKHLIG